MINGIDKLAWLYIQDRKLLCVRSKGKEAFYIPGGKREEGENDEQALIREIKEELSVDLVTISINYANTFTAQADGKEKGVLVKLTCFYSDYLGALQADEEIEVYEFMNTLTQVERSLGTILVMDWLKSQDLID